MSEQETNTLESFDIQRLLELLPHRYPFLLVDRIVDIAGDERATGIKNVTINEPHFTGHFPGMPVMPGVLIIEAMAQTAGAICLHAVSAGSSARVFFMTIDNAKFRKPVVPGDRLEIHVQKQKKRGQVWRFACTATVEGQKVAEAEIAAIISGGEAN